MVVDQAPTILCEQQAQTHWDATNAMELLGTSLADSVKNTAKLVPGAVNYLRSVESELPPLSGLLKDACLLNYLDSLSHLGAENIYVCRDMNRNMTVF